MAAMFDSAFKTLHQNELLLMMDVHGITTSATGSMVDNIRELLSDHVFRGLCADSLNGPLTDIPVGCLDYLQEFPFCDRIRVCNVR